MKDLAKKIPNSLTLSRLVLGALVAALMVLEHFCAATVAFLLAQSTDYLNGTLARRWNAVSDFGQTADLLVDKAVTLMILGAFLNSSEVPLSMFCASCAREFLISTLRLIARKLGYADFLRTSAWGRRTSVILTLALGLMLFLAAARELRLLSEWRSSASSLVVVLAWVGVGTRMAFLLCGLWRDRHEGSRLIHTLLGGRSEG